MQTQPRHLDTEQFNIRLPVEIAQAIKADARRRDMSTPMLIETLWRAEVARQARRRNEEYKERLQHAER